jgi:hypothetical protein
MPCAHTFSSRSVDAAEDPYTSVEVLRGLYASIDYNRDGKISAREFNVYGELMFVSTDMNDDDQLSLEEFMDWDPGFATLAKEQGKEQPFNAWYLRHGI